MSATALTPVTIVTGFLGSGKTTLLNRVLGTAHGHRIAVVENEFGEVGIDARILLAEHNERIVEMSNGCICCSIRGDLADVLDRLHARRLSGEISFDRVMIETTGLADPGPIAQTFCIDPTLGAHYLLDAVITLIDAKYIEDQLERFPQIAGQIGFADCLLLSKVDLIDQAALDVLQGRIGAMNSRAPIRPTSFGAVPLDDILDLRAFSLGTALRLEGHYRMAPHKPYRDRVRSFVFHSHRAFDFHRLDAFLSRAVAELGANLLRCKGILAVEGCDSEVVFQGVRDFMSGDFGLPWRADADRQSVLVFIGCDLPEQWFQEGLDSCLV